MAKSANLRLQSFMFAIRRLPPLLKKIQVQIVFRKYDFKN